ncbi:MULTISPECIES: peptide deformylase [Nocardiaceae]|uniref:Peptide deformylase n=1 Tax=Rhodococcoides fascians D188 TaxID=1051973 RepID=G8JYX3_RHOFA|nr:MULTISPECIES: peptide deformylase [Rhodococcus]AET25244.1 putative (poly)peptide deformylase [Rhodococcus fascians D188]AMY56270.1 Peptide deformylase [Rhodococcus fascians D188]OZC43778.1 peptide deformylase [Rhodococcus sp. RS1C4]OZC51316.1 peptide deformylase [Rhodococcus sp. 06-621-2]OZC60735.1 peptide deformylase [Rhodococcus sp. 06-469-3-2]
MPVSELLRLGNARPIVRWGDPVLHTSARPVTDFGPDLQSLLADMFATNTAADGAGLAAQQVGIDLAVFIYDCSDETGTRRTGVVCNPVVELAEGNDRHLIDFGEGCLSLPGAYTDLARPEFSICRGQDQYGNQIELNAGGTLGRCFQHETDHINGIVFGDRLSKRKRKQLYRDHETVSEQYSNDWPTR